MREPDYNRILMALKREGEPDKVPFYEHLVDKEIIEAVLGKPIPTIPGALSGTYFEPPMKHKEMHVLALIKFYRKLGYDYVPFEIPLKLSRTNIEQTKDPARYSRGLRAWQSESKGAITTIEEFENYPWPGEPEEAADLTYIELFDKHLPENMGLIAGSCGGVFENVSWLMSLTHLLKAVYFDKSLVEKMFEKIGSLIYKVDELIVKSSEKLIALRMGDDLGYIQGTFLPPAMLRKYVFPWYKRLVDLAHSKDLPFILHSCGNLRRIMDDLINIGIDAKHSFEDKIEPVWEAKEKYGDKIALLGGVDVNKLATMPSDKLRRHVRFVLERCAPGGGYALGSGNSITNYIPIENYLAMLEEGEKYKEGSS